MERTSLILHWNGKALPRILLTGWVHTQPTALGLMLLRKFPALIL